MTTKLSVKLAIGVIAGALAIGTAPVAQAAESATQASPLQTAQSASTQPGSASATAASPAAPESSADSAAVPSPSTPLSGVLTDPHGHPLASAELHFQGHVDPDIFTVRARADGSFSTALPAGVYDLRDEHGAIIAYGVTVGQSAVSLGRVEAPAPLAPTRLFDRQAIGEVIVKSPAPSGAYVPAPGAAPAAVAAMPVANPAVQGGMASGKAMAPAQVVPMGVEQQLQIPPGDTSIGIPSMTGEAPAPLTGAQPTPAVGPSAPPMPSGGY